MSKPYLVREAYPLSEKIWRLLLEAFGNKIVTN